MVRRRPRRPGVLSAGRAAGADLHRGGVPGFAGRETALHGSAEFDGGAAAGAAPNSGNGRSDGTRPSGFLRRQSSLAGCVLYRTPGADHSHYRSQRGGQDHFGPVLVRLDEGAGRDDPVGRKPLGPKRKTAWNFFSLINNFFTILTIPTH